jgi:hypothetical protein
VTLTSLGDIEYSFVSGAFNSPTGKRVQGSELSQELINKVVEAISAVVDQKRVYATVSPSSTTHVTPESKRPRTLPRCLFSLNSENRESNSSDKFEFGDLVTSVSQG